MSEENTPRFNRLCAVFLSLQWIGFGVMHFTSMKQTEMMIPQFVTDLGTGLGLHNPNAFISISTGILEVAIGICLLVPALRKPAAWASLALIILYIPAVYTILMLPRDEAWIGPMQALIVPNNIVLALFSYHLARGPKAIPSSAASKIEGLLKSFRP